MQIAFEGWQRNHGMKVMLNRPVRADQTTDNPFPLKEQDLKLKPLRPEEDLMHGVRVYFHTDMRLGGSQMGVLTLSRKELIVMLKKSLGEMTFEKFVEVYQAA